MQRTFRLATALSIAAHVAVIGVYAPGGRAPAEWKSNPTQLTQLKLRGTRSATSAATRTDAQVALPVVAVASIANPPPLRESSIAAVQLAPREPADIAPPIEPELVATTTVSGIALPRLGIASPFGGLRRARDTDFAVQSAAMAYAQQREAALHADRQAHLGAAAAMAARTIAPCEPTAPIDCPEQ